MKVAVIGITPIGCTIACLLKLAGTDVTIIGPADRAEMIAEMGITIRQSWDSVSIYAPVPSADALDFAPDVAIFAANTQDTGPWAEKLAPFIKESTIATIQYGNKTEQIIAKALPHVRDNIVTCVLTIGAICHRPGDVTLNFKGHMVVGRAYGASEESVESVRKLMRGVFHTHRGEKIAHYNCTRLLLNLPYCIPGIIGEKVQRAFMDHDTAKVAVLLLKEGTRIIKKAGVHIAPLPDFDKERLNKLLSLPLDEAAVRFGEIVMSMSRLPCEGPVLGSIEQGEPSEIDYQNGEMVKIGRAVEYPAPLNELVVSLVHQVERTREFFSKEEFLRLVAQAAASG